MGSMRRRGIHLWVVAALGLAACGNEASAEPNGQVTTIAPTVAPTQTLPGPTTPVTAAPATSPPTTSTAATTTPPATTAVPIPETTLSPVETTVPPTTEPPLTLPLITLQTVPAPLPTLPDAPPAPSTLPADPGTGTSGGGGSGGGGGSTGSGLGRIEIPKLGISASLQSGVDIPTLNKGPGHWPGTALPGQAGNGVIAGHRTSHGGIFRNINNLVAGDQIIFDGPNGRFTYVVTGIQIVAPDAMWIVGQDGGPRVTLFACHPPGSTRQRIVVFADLVR